MNVFDSIKNKNIDELVDWLDEHFAFDESPWWKWWDKNYCNQCISENKDKCAYCELHGNCRFFKDMDEIPSKKQTIKMWLESENKYNI